MLLTNYFNLNIFNLQILPTTAPTTAPVLFPELLLLEAPVAANLFVVEARLGSSVVEEVSASSVEYVVTALLLLPDTAEGDLGLEEEDPPEDVLVLLVDDAGVFAGVLGCVGVLLGVVGVLSDGVDGDEEEESVVESAVVGF